MNHKKTAHALVVGLTLGLGGLMSAAFTSVYAGHDSIVQRVQTDKAFFDKRGQAIDILRKRGYQAQRIEAYNHLGKPALSIIAQKNGKLHEVIMIYPSLKILKERQL